jgi:bacillithiol synthase
VKIERVDHPRPGGHPLGRELLAYASDFVRAAYPRPVSPRSVLEAAKALRPITKVAADRVEEGMRRLGLAPPKRLIDALRGGAAIIAAGQQPGLFGGTLLTLQKAAAAVAVAREATKAGVPAVALFWAQGEDHDLEEVNRFEAERDGGFERLRAPIPDEGRRLGDLVLDAATVEWIDRVESEAGAIAARTETSTPRAGDRLVDWSLRSTFDLVGDDLLVAEPSWFHDLAAPFLRSAVRDFATFDAAFARDTDAVRAAGFQPQVEAGAPGGLFLIDDDGRRKRLSAARDRWTLDSGRDFSESELLDLLDAEPGRFSPNVQLRAPAQQAILPIAAHVGGPAEIAYFAQFPSLFKAANLPMPAMIPRPTATVLGPKEAKLREALGLDARALLDDPETWAADAPTDARVEALFDAFASAEEAAWAPLFEAADVEPLARAVTSQRDDARRRRDKLKGTFLREAERRLGVERNRKRRLAEWVRPKGRPQERVLSPPHVLSRASKAAVRTWLSATDPFDPRHVVCTFEEEDRA